MLVYCKMLEPSYLSVTKCVNSSFQIIDTEIVSDYFCLTTSLYIYDLL